MDPFGKAMLLACACDDALTQVGLPHAEDARPVGVQEMVEPLSRKRTERGIRIEASVNQSERRCNAHLVSNLS